MVEEFKEEGGSGGVVGGGGKRWWKRRWRSDCTFSTCAEVIWMSRRKGKMVRNLDVACLFIV